MATLDGNLWEYNLARVVVVDVSDDYRLMQPPLPSECYPVLAEMWVPCLNLARRLPKMCLVDGYLYDWHESPDSTPQTWYVGVVSDTLVTPASITAQALH